jgi:hypothetical protein
VRHDPGKPVSKNTQQGYAQAMRHLRICIRLLTALLLASIAHAVTDGLTPGLMLGLALTTLLLVAALGLWRTGSRCRGTRMRSGRRMQRASMTISNRSTNRKASWTSESSERDTSAGH